MSDQASGTNNTSANSRKLYFCHQCRRNIEALMAPDPTCPICNDTFVEEIGENSDPGDLIEHGGGQESDDEFDDTIPFPTNPTNGQPDFVQHILQLLSNLPGNNLQVQTESRDGTTTITATATATATATGSPPTTTTTTTTPGQRQQNETNPDQQGNRQQQRPNQPNIIFMGSNVPNAGENNPFVNLTQMFQRVLESGGVNNTANFFNLFNMAGNPGDYAWGNNWDNIITQLMEQQAGRQAPPPATDEMIDDLPKTKISKKQVVEEQLGCPVCKDEFQIDEDAVYLPCTHTFHFDCIKPWLKMNGTCPVCRYSLVVQEDKEPNEQNNNNNNGDSSNNNNLGSSSSTIIFNSNSSLPGTYPGNQQNNGQQNQDEDNMDLD